MGWTQNGNIRGASGIPGASGTPGASGASGAQGASGSIGATGASGPTGASGGTGGTGGVGASGPGFYRVVSTITSPATLGASGSTDYVYLLSGTAADTTTKLLLHGDGSNGSTTFTDSSASNRTMTRSGATISTTQSKFGGASMSFSGGNYVSVTSSDFAFGNGDFTIECFVYLTTLNSYNHIMGTRQTSGNDANGFSMLIVSTGEIVLYNDGFHVLSAAGTVTTNSWQHYAISRSGNTVKIFKNGSQVASGSYSKNNTNTTFSVGGQVGDASHPTTGYIDELRVTNTAVYTANFTAPSSAFANPDSGSLGTPTLPTATSNSNRYALRNISGSTIIVGASGSQKINGATGGYSLANSSAVELISDGSSGWYAI